MNGRIKRNGIALFLLLTISSVFVSMAASEDGSGQEKKPNPLSGYLPLSESAFDPNPEAREKPIQIVPVEEVTTSVSFGPEPTPTTEAIIETSDSPAVLIEESAPAQSPEESSSVDIAPPILEEPAPAAKPDLSFSEIVEKETPENVDRELTFPLTLAIPGLDAEEPLYPVDDPIDSESSSIDARSADYRNGIESEDPLLKMSSPAVVGVGATLGDSESEIYIDALVPFWQSQSDSYHTIAFLVPRLPVSEKEEKNASIGLGIRSLRGEGAFMGNSFPWIIGANAFYDFTSSSNDFDYHQWGAGLEWMSPYLDMRVNGYFPQTSENIVDETSETSVSTSSSTTTSTSFGTLFPSGHNVFQNFTTTTTTTTSRTSTTRFFEQYERALKGFDGEAGILVPEHLTWFPIRFYGGFYSFENPYGDDITGPKARIEARPFSFLLLDAAWYQDEELLGSNWFLNARAEITIGGSPRPTTSSKPLHDTTEGPKTEAYNPYASFRSRLVERIPRNYTSVLTISPFLENETLRQVSTSRSSISEVETGQITIASRLIFVDAARGSLTGSGTWQSPANTIQGGADLAISKLGSGGQIWTVWTQGEVGPYAEDVTVTNSVRFTSSSIPITGRGGQRFGGSGNGPVVQGGFLFGTLPAGPASPSIPVGSIQGYEITGGHSGANFAAVTFVNVENATFSQNRIDTIGGNGIEVFNTGSTEASGTFASNGIFNTGGSAIRLNLSGDSISSYSIRDSGFQNLADNAVRVDASDTADFDINVERLSASGLSNAAVFLNATDDSTGSISMRNSSFDGGGADATLAGNAQATLAVTGTRIENDPNSVFLLNADDDAELTTRIQNNILEDNASAFEMEISGSAVSDTLFSGNRIENTTSRAVFARFASSGTHDMTISGNSLSSVDGDGLVLVASNGDVDADVSQNTVDTATGRGIVLRTSASGDMDATASGNILSNVASGGVLARSTGSSDLDADLSDNQVSNSGAYGLRFQADNAAAQIGSSATENTIRDTVDSAVELIANNDALMDVVVSRNIIVDVAAAGIRSVASDDSFVRLVATFNNISNSTDEGISFTAQDDSFADFQAFNNQIASTGNASGIGLFSSGDSFTQGVINGNQIGPTAQQGIEIEGSDTASGFLSITSNQINDTSQDGIRATLQSTQSQSINVRDNNFQSIGANAINLTTEDNKGATIFDNQIGTTGGFALRVDMQSAGLLLNGSTQGDNQYTDATPAPFLNAGGTPAGDGVRINGVVYP